MTFQEKFQKNVLKNNSLLCIGLDPQLDKIPQRFRKSKHPLFDFNKSIIDQTYDQASVYKLNFAFYEASGLQGLGQLITTVKYLKKKISNIPIILDYKRADIPNTAKMLATAAFEIWQADAVTVYPYLGRDSLNPFLDYKDRYIFALVKTSNPDAAKFQDIKVKGKIPLYQYLAKELARWPYQNLGIFVGATYPDDLAKIRSLFPDRIFLSAGIGAQKADIKKAVKAGVDKNNSSIIFNASRSIIYSQNPRSAAQKLKNEINKYRF